jgi:hypothetical protein
MAGEFENSSDLIFKRRVKYTGTDALEVGYLLCYDRDYGTAASSDMTRAWNVEKPATANLNWFAGICQTKLTAGPGFVDIIVPIGGPLTEVWSDQNCTLGTTKLAVKNASYAAGAASETTVTIGTAFQTVDRSGTDGLVLTQLRPASTADTDVMGVVASIDDDMGGTTGGTEQLTFTSSAIDDDSGGTTGGTEQLNPVQGSGYSAAVTSAINDNFAVLAAEFNQLRTDVANLGAVTSTQINAIISSAQTANLMATS